MSLFWANVKKLLPYKNLEVKDLAFRAGVSYSTIINGMNKNSMPHADLALKIAKILNISLENLLGEDSVRIVELEPVNQIECGKKELELYQKYKSLINALETLPLAVRESAQDLLLKMAAVSTPQS